MCDCGGAINTHVALVAAHLAMVAAEGIVKRFYSVGAPYMNARRITPRYLLPSFFLVIFRPVIYNEAGHPLCQCVSCYFRVVLCIYKKVLVELHCLMSR